MFFLSKFSRSIKVQIKPEIPLNSQSYATIYSVHNVIHLWNQWCESQFLGNSSHIFLFVGSARNRKIKNKISIRKMKHNSSRWTTWINDCLKLLRYPYPPRFFSFFIVFKFLKFQRKYFWRNRTHFWMFSIN